MKFASALLVSAASAAPLFYGYGHRYRTVPVTTYETVYETKYRDVEKEGVRDVEEHYTVDVPIIHRLVHDVHSSDGDEYQGQTSDDYKNSHSHGPGDFYGIEEPYHDSDYSDELHYEGDQSPVGDSSSSANETSVSSDITGMKRGDDDDNRWRGGRDGVYGADLSSSHLGTSDEGADDTDAESFEQCAGGRKCSTGKKASYSFRFLPREDYGLERGGDSQSSDDDDQSDDLHYHRFQSGTRQETRTRTVQEPFTYTEKEAFKVAKKVPKTVYKKVPHYRW